jgi:hypothetical protein
MRVKVNLSTGRSEILVDEPLFEPVTASLEIADTRFEIRQDVVVVTARCESQRDLSDLMSTVYYAFPAILNVFLPDAPYPTHGWGVLGESRFRWLFDPAMVTASTVVTSKKNQEELITSAWRLIAQAAESRRLMGGVHYFHVGCRLLAAGYNRFEFTAEALLNFAKSLQSAFGDTRDAVRKELAKLGLFSDTEIEAKYLPALLLRDQFDVAHISFSLLTSEQLRTLHDCTNLAEQALRDLYKALFEKLESGEYVMPPDTALVLASDKETLLRRLAKGIKPFV